MNRKYYYSAVAVSAAATGMVLFTSTQASAQLQDPQPWGSSSSQPAQNVPPGWPDEGSGYPGFADSTIHKSGKAPASHKPEYNYPNYDPKYGVAQATTSSAADSHDTRTEIVQSGASALGGAAVALSCVSLYRRHQLRTT